MFIQYAGHGTNIRDDNNDENDGRDECLVPLDYRGNNYIRDDYLASIFKNVHTTVIGDCHSCCGFCLVLVLNLLLLIFKLLFTLEGELLFKFKLFLLDILLLYKFKLLYCCLD